MKTTLFSTVGAIALTSLAITLAPTTASAHSSGNSGHSSGRSSGHSSRSCSRGHDRGHCDRLPHGCRQTNYRGQRCWFDGNHYYGCGSFGGYVILDQPEVEVQETVVEQPEVEVEETISALPDDSETVYVGGERCWFHEGCYYRHCGHGYQKFHCKDRGHGRGHDTCKNNRGRGSRTSRTCSTHNSGHHSSHSTGHSSGHGRR